MTGTAIQTNGPGKSTTAHLNFSVTLAGHPSLLAHYADVRARLYGRRRPQACAPIPAARPGFEPELPCTCPMNMLALPSWKFLRAYVAAKHGVEVEEIASRTHQRKVVRARNELAYLMSTTMGWSSKKIGALLGRDHASILNSLKQHRKAMEAAQ